MLARSAAIIFPLISVYADDEVSAGVYGEIHFGKLARAAGVFQADRLTGTAAIPRGIPVIAIEQRHSPAFTVAAVKFIVSVAAIPLSAAVSRARIKRSVHIHAAHLMHSIPTDLIESDHLLLCHSRNHRSGIDFRP